MKRLAAWLLAILMMTSAACAEIDWGSTPSSVQTHLAPYIARVNEALAQGGAGVVDVAYEVYPAFASLGMDGFTMPDNVESAVTLPVEMQFRLSDDGLYSLTLRVSDVTRFTPIAAACLHACSPQSVPLEYARSIAYSYAKIALDDIGQDVTHAFSEDVVDLQGDNPRAYFAYFPNQYGDGVTWMQMTLIFPRTGASAGNLIITVTPEPGSGYIDPQADPDYEGYLPDPEGSFDHYEQFPMPTPEPDSAAMERW